MERNPVNVEFQGGKNGMKSSQSRKALERSKNDNVGSWCVLMITSFHWSHGPVLWERHSMVNMAKHAEP